MIYCKTPAVRLNHPQDFLKLKKMSQSYPLEEGSADDWSLASQNNSSNNKVVPLLFNNKLYYLTNFLPTVPYPKFWIAKFTAVET